MRSLRRKSTNFFVHSINAYLDVLFEIYGEFTAMWSDCNWSTNISRKIPENSVNFSTTSRTLVHTHNFLFNSLIIIFKMGKSLCFFSLFSIFENHISRHKITACRIIRKCKERFIQPRTHAHSFSFPRNLFSCSNLYFHPESISLMSFDSIRIAFAFAFAIVIYSLIHSLTATCSRSSLRLVPDSK